MKYAMTERDYYLGFSVFQDIGPVRFRLLIDYFGSAKRAWESSYAELIKINLNPKIAARFCDFRSKFSLPSFISGLKSKNVSFLTLADSEYPKLLKEISDPPIIIYIRGDLTRLKKIKNSVAIVGTRKMTFYGKIATEKIVTGLVDGGFTIVSGMAEGIDTIAHKTAIRGQGSTIAVLGNGIDIIYPASNYDLYWQIVKESGLILSEYPPGLRPSRSSFPLRNRIIAGFAKAVVVVEGKVTSGALITAKYALEAGREVFAVPGPINYPTSEGTTYLIKHGASIATMASDIFEGLNV